MNFSSINVKVQGIILRNFVNGCNFHILDIKFHSNQDDFYLILVKHSCISLLPMQTILVSVIQIDLGSSKRWWFS